MSYSHYPEPIRQFITLDKPEEIEGNPYNWLNYVQHFNLTSEHVPDLIRMCTDEALHNEEAPYHWAPLHAWRALGQLGAEQAVKPLIDLLIKFEESEWVGQDLPLVLAMIGEAALEPVIAVLTEKHSSEWANIDFADVLAILGRHRPHLKTRCLEALSEQLQHFKQNTKTFNAYLILDIVELEGKEYLPLIKQVYDSQCVDESVFGDYEDVEIELGIRPKPDIPFTQGRFPETEPDDDHDDGSEVFTEDETEKLYALLNSAGPSAEVMTLPMLEGYLYGLVITPDMVFPNEWLPPIYGDTNLGAVSVEKTRERLDVLLAVYNRLLGLYHENLMPAPSLASVPMEELIMEWLDELGEWCMGFLEAFKLRGDLWMEGFDLAPENEDTMSLELMMLGMLAEPEMALNVFEEDSSEKNWDEEKKRKVKIEVTTLAVRTFPLIIQDFILLSQRISQRLSKHRSKNKSGLATLFPPPKAPPPESRHAGQKTGRNDPCPCGSGKKYKKCCLPRKA